ncbi:MAG: PD-(D/E)XK nuclease family protein [Maribacter sp.]|nr:PD-(D/E)XK nuclease family protein [Maribacter sp.]
MHSFLEEIVNQVYSDHESLEDTIFILPSKRAGTFLRNGIANITHKTIFSPEIYSIEEFVGNVSGLSSATNTQQLFELYYAYLGQNKTEDENFLDFSKWGQTLLQDFNEIDRYLINTGRLFSNLSAIQEINHWYLTAEKTKMVEDYIKFWNNLEELYNTFNQRLLEQGIGHQGLIYRKAHENLESYLKTNSENRYIFIGFNALNTAESNIIQRILETKNAEIYWDTDEYYLNDPIHDAGFFIRNHQKKWPYLHNNPIKGTTASFLQKKKIQIVGVPKNISQVKYVGSLLKKLNVENSDLLKRTAVVLSDETLLNPLLNSIPSGIDKVNVTMGYPLNKSNFDSFFMQFFDLYIKKQDNGWYYKNVLSFLSHSYTSQLLQEGTTNLAEMLASAIKDRNLTFLTENEIIPYGKNKSQNLSKLFFDKSITAKQFIERCLELVILLKTKLQASGDKIALEELFRFYGVFNQIQELLGKHGFLNDLKSLQTLFKELLAMETLDFKGDPLEGLQIMGMLESRNLDFETVIITSVNEGIIPSGKSNNSFIPFDLKKAFGLPTFKEKDAVYTYHFYRLLQRAKNIYLIYNTEPDVLEGGERSRLITQLLTDGEIKEHITEFIAVPEIKVKPNKECQIVKDDSLMALIQGHAIKGFSPSSLTNYIRNPIDFYKQNLLGINDMLEVEETVAANTFGTIIHDTLEDLYTPLIGEYLSNENLKSVKTKIGDVVKKHFKKSYADTNFLRGKNLIAYNVIINYIENYFAQEIVQSKRHQIKILGLEAKMEITMNIPELQFPIKLKGKIDRIDEKDGELRIIDYKSGKVMSNQVEIFDWSLITEDYKYSKAFQLLCYALMFNDSANLNQLEAGIVSFKNLNAGILNFATKESKTSRRKDKAITPETLNDFAKELKSLVLEICNPNIPFVEKEV